jgi:hypothetical protein
LDDGRLWRGLAALPCLRTGSAVLFNGIRAGEVSGLGLDAQDPRAAIVNAIGPICQLVRTEEKTPLRYLVIVPGTPDNHGAPVQVQSEYSMIRMIRTQASSVLAQGNT